jgi:hypothetical protein
VDGLYPATMEWHGKSVSLFAVTIAMIILPLVVVPLRCYVRITRRAFKIDDWLIIAALIFHLGACAVTLWGFTYGLGMPDKVLSPENQMKGVQVCFNTLDKYARYAKQRLIKITDFRNVQANLHTSNLLDQVQRLLYIPPSIDITEDQKSTTLDLDHRVLLFAYHVHRIFLLLCALPSHLDALASP